MKRYVHSVFNLRAPGEHLLVAKAIGYATFDATMDSRLGIQRWCNVEQGDEPMSIPDYQTVMLPLLRQFADGQSHFVRDLVEPLGDEFKLTEEERAELLPSGAQQTFRNRIGWASSYITKAGLLERVARGQYRITERGQHVLSTNVQKIDVNYLNRFPEFREFREPKDSRSKIPDSIQSHESSETPLELIQRSYKYLRRELAQDLLEEIKSSSPAFFERLVIDLLVAMGYGGTLSDAARAVGRARDGGIDGIIKEDKLGLDTIYVQAKRWDSVVGSQIVQAFAGSLEGQRARKGVMITTSWFSDSAHRYVDRIGNRIVLIEGETLAQLMIEHGVGVTAEESYTIYRLDLDYFDDV